MIAIITITIIIMMVIIIIAIIIIIIIIIMIKKVGPTGYMCLRCTYFVSCAVFSRYHQVPVSSLEAIRRIFGVGELSYILLQTELLMCIMIGLQ